MSGGLTDTGTKTCTRCRNHHAEPTKMCGPCKLRCSDRCRARRRAEPEKHRAYNRRYRKEHPDQVRETLRKSQARRSAANRSWKLRRNYGLSAEEHASILVKQQGRCAMPGCEQNITGVGRGGRHLAHTDHDRETGKLGDNERGLLNALKYLRSAMSL